MKTINKQQYILQLLQKAENKTMLKKEIVDAVCKVQFYYANAEKHIGEVLARMVKSKLIHRPKKGHYSIGYVDNQPNLFNQK